MSIISSNLPSQIHVDSVDSTESLLFHAEYAEFCTVRTDLCRMCISLSQIFDKSP
jgi:hypothetical protein